jgi:hypothetical protein
MAAVEFRLGTVAKTITAISRAVASGESGFIDALLSHS